VTILEELLDDLEETLWSEGKVPLYEFSWFLRGLGRGLSEGEIAELCERAYNELTRRHELGLAWFRWPGVRDRGRAAPPDTPLDFDIDTTGEVASPFLALVPRRPSGGRS